MRNFENSTPHFKHVDTKHKELRSLIQLSVVVVRVRCVFLSAKYFVVVRSY